MDNCNKMRKFQISRLFLARISLIFRQLQSVDSLWNAYVTWKNTRSRKLIFRHWLGPLNVGFTYLSLLLNKMMSQHLIWVWYAFDMRSVCIWFPIPISKASELKNQLKEITSKSPEFPWKVIYFHSSCKW